MKYICPLSDICYLDKKHCDHKLPHDGEGSCEMSSCSFTHIESNYELGLEAECVPCFSIPEGDFIGKDEFEI